MNMAANFVSVPSLFELNDHIRQVEYIDKVKFVRQSITKCFGDEGMYQFFLCYERCHRPRRRRFFLSRPALLYVTYCDLQSIATAAMFSI